MNNVMLAPVEFRNQEQKNLGRLVSLAIKGLVPMLTVINTCFAIA